VTIRVFLKQGLLGENVQQIELPGDVVTTPRDVCERLAQHLPVSVPIVVAVDGVRVEGDELDVELEDGQQLILLPQTAGEGVVGAIAYALITVAISFAVNYVISLLNPPPKPPGVAQERGDDGSQTYAWDGIKTNYGPGLPIPWIYGHNALGGQGIWTDAQASRSSSQQAVDDRLRLILSLCEGPVHRIGGVGGFVSGMGGFAGGTPGPQIPVGITINGNLLEHTNPLPGAMASLRIGTQDQPAFGAPFTGIRQTFTELADLNELGDQHVFTFADTSEVSFAAIVFFFPSGLYQQLATGGIAGLSVTFGFSWRPQGAASWNQLGLSNQTVGSFATPIVGAHASTSASQNPAQFGAQFPPGLRGPIEIRVVRVSGSLGTLGVSQCVLRDVVIGSPHTLRYPLEAVLALELQAGARFSGGLPQISTPVKGALVRVWDVINGWGPPCWDVPPAPFNFNAHPPGRNPAWCLLDYLLNERWGLGQYLRETDIDLPAFRRWAAFCDSDPDPDEPWGEPQFTIDLVGDRPRPHWEWVLTFCSAGRATPVMRDGKISVVYQYRDEHGDFHLIVPEKGVTQLITSGNCEKVQLKWLSKANRPTVYQYQFLDENKNWTQDVLPVEDDEGSLNDPTELNQDKYRPEVVQAYGETRPQQLFRAGVWRHRITRMVRRELTFVTGPWALAAEVGDLIDFEHEMLRPFAADVPVAMQVLAFDDLADPPTLTIDHALSGSGLQVVVRDEDGKPQRRTIDAFTNTTVNGKPASILELAAATVGVVVGAACVVGKTDKLTETYQIVAISLQQDLKREVQAIQWTPDAYDPITEEMWLGTGDDAGTDTVLEPQDTDDLPPAVLGLRVALDLDGSYVISWARPANKAGTWARVYVRPADVGVWTLIGATELDQLPYRGLRAGRAYVVSVCLENRRGDPVPPDLGDLLTFTPEEFPPYNLPAVTNARATISEGHLLLEWDDLQQRDVDYYEVRAGSNWAAGQVLARGRAPRAYIPDPPRSVLRVAARSTSGLYGPLVQIADSGWAPPHKSLAIDENDLSPSPAGTHTNTTWNSTDGVIELAAGALAGTYVSLEQDAAYQAPWYWQVRVDRHELEDVLVQDLDFLLNSGEARWRQVDGRPASPASPGIDWRVLVEDLDMLVSDLPATLMATGNLGVVGSHTQALVESRFWQDTGAGFAWSGYTPHVDRIVVARKIQVRLSLGRRLLRYRARVGVLHFATYL
jgi:hypothetical protein